MKIDDITKEIIGSAIEIHTFLGPGLLESAYEACLLYELQNKSFRVEQQKPLPVTYKDVKLETAYRLDLLVENRIIVEIKCVERLLPIHTAQLLSYLKLAGIEVGLLINFNVIMLKNGIKRIVNDYKEQNTNPKIHK